ncbi:helix-turn-helix domain-containing protein [Micromonospora chalcea]|uniref:helix-turn-helix domain-containing protein n=1 Tax=Micromonospora chalcea TaxID=1874 RepID=UPI0021A5D197|nr:helix-turn-helix domain-containing protein [Micromonospora chalcea]MCT2280879.1 helix-turn-helix domain-containing protein [Micromonospora chalcea]
MTASAPRDPKIPDLVSIQEAADLLGISKQAVHKRVDRGQLVGAPVGNTYVFRRVVIEAARPAPPAE